jgi:hypothetical protein
MRAFDTLSPLVLRKVKCARRVEHDGEDHQDECTLKHDETIPGRSGSQFKANEPILYGAGKPKNKFWIGTEPDETAAASQRGALHKYYARKTWRTTWPT